MPKVVEQKAEYPVLRVFLCRGDGAFPDAETAKVAELLTAAGIDPKNYLPYRPAMPVEKVKQFLGWEEEPDYTKRKLAEAEAAGKKLKPEAALFPKGEWTLLDNRGVKVKCWKCSRNRPFNEGHMAKLAQDRLNGHWRFNGESTIGGKFGQVLSAQHRMISFVYAEQMRQDSDFWRKKWPNPLTYEGVVVVGVDEDLETTNTLDNVLPRSLGDVLYTSDVFRDIKSSYDRKEITRMLDAAVDFLWQRTRAGTSEHHKFQTHSESQDFLGRHHKLLAAVKHLFQENRERGISVNKLSPGQCAAICYLMGSSKSDWSKYANMDVPSERVLDFSMWDKATKFWVDLAKGNLGPLVAAIGAAMDDTAKLSTWKQVLLAKAWYAYSRGMSVTTDMLDVKYDVDEAGRRHLKDEEYVGFGGIDQGPQKPAAIAIGDDLVIADPAEVETAKETKKKGRMSAADLQAKLDQKKAEKAAAKSNGSAPSSGGGSPSARAQAAAPVVAATK